MRATYSDTEYVLIGIWKAARTATYPMRALKYSRTEPEQRGTLDKIFGPAMAYAFERLSRHLASRREASRQIQRDELNIHVHLGQSAGKEGLNTAVATQTCRAGSVGEVAADSEQGDRYIDWVSV